MTMSRKSLLRRLYCGISVAALLLALSFNGSRAVRAADPDALTPLLETIVTPIIISVQGMGQKLSGLEDTVGAFADSFTSRRVVAQMLCVADDSGAQTCITKAQLDSLLKRVAQAEVSQPADAAVNSGAHAEVAQPSDTAEISPASPAETASEASAQPPAESVDSVTATEPTPPPPANVQGSLEQPDQGPDYTGTLQTASTGAAVLLHPEIEISIVPGARSED
jgi:hypothetical protein